ncbi:MAG: magnesium and cobalt transport protein CorA, partial [Flavobacteriales bacterium]
MAKSKRRLRQNYALKKGLPPGTLHYIGADKNFDIHVEQITYNEQEFHRKENIKIEALMPDDVHAPVRWINITGIHEYELISQVGKTFQIHPLVLEDIMHTEQRPKLEEYDNYIYVVLRMISPNENNGDIRSEQVSLLIFQNTVITFQENSEDIFDNLRDRIKKGAGKIRKSSAGYLAYCLLDTIVDYYFVVLEQIGEKLEDAESKLIEQQEQLELNLLHHVKRELIFLRKSIWPLREVINYLSKSETRIISNDTSVYFRDVYDHCIHMLDTLESYRDLTSG